MVELFVRLIASAAVSAWSWLFAPAHSETVLKVAAGFAAFSIFVFLFERRDLRNAGSSGLIAAADAMAIGIVLGALNRLDSVGFLVLTPCAYAAARFGSLPTAMAPIAATALLVGQVLFFPGQDPSPTLYAQMGGVLAVGLLLNHRRIVVTETIEVPSHPIEEVTEAPPPDAYMELRESYRSLRDHYRDLSVKSRRDRHAVEIYNLLFDREDRTVESLSSRLREITGADGALLFRLSKIEDVLVVRDLDGNVPEAIAGNSFSVRASQVASSIKGDTESALKALLDDETRPRLANVPLRHQGRLEGMLTLFADPSQLPGVLETAEEIAPYVAIALHEAERWQNCTRRAQRAELMYELGAVTHGSTTANHLAARTAEALGRMLSPERLSIWWLDGDDALLASHVGTSQDALRVLSFGAGSGIAGWRRSNGPEVWMPDTLQDSRMHRNTAIKQRIRSLIVLPIELDAEPVGYLCMSSSRAGDVDAEAVETLRLAVANLGPALARLRGGELTLEGLVTSGEFQQALGASESAAIVTLEPLRQDAVIERFGLPTFNQARRRYSLQLCARLPKGGCIRPQADGSFLVLLPNTDSERAKSWANEMAAMASFIGLSVEGGARVPMAFRARVGERVAEPDADLTPTA